MLKKGLVPFLIVLLTLSFVIANVMTNSTNEMGSLSNTTGDDQTNINEIIEEPVANPKLATNINGVPIEPLKLQEYAKYHNNFSSLWFERINDKTEVSTLIKVGLSYNAMKGYTLDARKYVIEVVACDRKSGSCSLLINGISTRNIFPPLIKNSGKQIEFDLDGNYSMVINSIKFDYCDNKRMCDYDYESYHIVNVSIKRK